MGPLRRWKRQSHAVTHTARNLIHTITSQPGHNARAVVVCVHTFDRGGDGLLDDRAGPGVLRVGVANPQVLPALFADAADAANREAGLVGAGGWGANRNVIFQ